MWCPQLWAGLALPFLWAFPKQTACHAGFPALLPQHVASSSGSPRLAPSSATPLGGPVLNSPVLSPASLALPPTARNFSHSPSPHPCGCLLPRTSVSDITTKLCTTLPCHPLLFCLLPMAQLRCGFRIWDTVTFYSSWKAPALGLPLAPSVF